MILSYIIKRGLEETSLRPGLSKRPPLSAKVEGTGVVNGVEKLNSKISANFVQKFKFFLKFFSKILFRHSQSCFKCSLNFLNFLSKVYANFSQILSKIDQFFCKDSSIYFNFLKVSENVLNF